MKSRIGGWGVALGALLLPCLAHAQTYSKTETIEYSDNLTTWVLGQVKRTTTDGIEVSRTDYNATTALPMATYSFGKLQQSLTYNADGTVATVQDGGNHVTTFPSWKRGIPQIITYPATTDQPTAVAQKATVDDNGWITSATDENGFTTCYGYDAMGRISRVTYPSESVAGTCDTSTWAASTQSFQQVASVEYGIPANHWRQTVSTGNGNTVTYFDAMWRPLVVEAYDSANVANTRSISANRYDASGRLVFQSYPRSSLSSYADTTLTGTVTSYDVLTRVTRVAQDSELGVLATAIGYLNNPSGPYTVVTNPRGYQTRTWYQAFDQPDLSTPVEIWQPEGVYTDISRDVFGKPLSLTRRDAASSIHLTRSYVYDANQLLCRTSDPEAGATVMHYDAVGNMDWSADGLSITGTGCGQEQVAATARTTRSYDARNRMLALLPPSGTQSTSYAHDAVGHLTRAISGVSTWTATYDARSLLTGETLQLAGQSPWHLGYLHDAYGSVRQLTYPNGETVAYAPDALGRATQVGSYASHLGYFPNGAVAGFTYGNGAGHVAAQNARQLLRNFTDGTAGALNLSEDLTYDADGNITKVTDLAGGPRSKTFGYDGLNRLTSATASSLWGTQTYSYDPLNNIRTRVGNGQTVTYSYDPSNRLASLSGVGSFVYDNRGNVISRNGASLVFDQKNQLTQVSGVASYAYDAAGRRVQKTPSSGSPTYYFYNQAGLLVYQWEPASNKATHFILLGRTTIARSMRIGTGTPTVIYSYTDPQGTPLVRADAQGTVTSTFDYTPYGTVALGPQPDGAGYTGHVNDPDTGLVYMQARYYDPVAGRFLSVDPVTADGNTGGNFNRYWYANNNPYRFTDPDGRCAAQDKSGCTEAIPYNPFRDTFLGRAVSNVFGNLAAVFSPTNTNPLSGEVLNRGQIQDAKLGILLFAAPAPAKTEAAVADALKPMARGVASEARVLLDMGLTKNTQAVATVEGKAVPDALTATRSIEIKDTLCVACTKQIRIQTDAARETGRESVLITGSKTRVYGPAEKAFDRIITRDDLGPQ